MARTLFENPRYFALFVLVILALGISSLTTIARQEDPSITNFAASIVVPYPGASPDTVEALVTRPLEDELRKIDEIDNIYSTSSTGTSSTRVILVETLQPEEMERVWSEVRDSIDDAARFFPAGAGDAELDNDRLSAYTAIVTLRAASGRDVSLALISRIADSLADALRNVRGTKLVDVYGEQAEEIRVAVNEVALSARGLSLDEVAAALRSADSRRTAGRTGGLSSDLMVSVAGEFDSIDRIEQVIVSTSGDGRATRVQDIAKVQRTVVTPAATLAIVDGQSGIMVAVQMQTGLQVDRWAQQFRDEVAEFERNAPDGIELTISYDQSTYTVERLSSVLANLGVGIALVLCVLLFTLGWRAAVVVAVILPVSALLSIAILEKIGLAIHQMSLSGLIVALGLLVDGAIVMTDELRKRLQAGSSQIEAIRQSVLRLRMPLLASTFTTVLAFMPMAILPGPAGDFPGSIATAVIVMLLSSLLLALAITPVLAAKLLPKEADANTSWYVNGARSGMAGRWLERALDWSLHYKVAAICLALSLPLAGFLSFPTLIAQFFPGTDRDQMYVQVKLPDGASIYQSRELALRVDDFLREDGDIRRIDWSIGESAPAFYYNMYRNKDGIASWAEALVFTKNAKVTDDLVRRLQPKLDRAFPEAQLIVRGLDQGPPVSAPVEIKVVGPDLDTLRRLGEELRLRMENVPSVTHSRADIMGGAPKIEWRMDEEELRLANLQLADASRALNNSLVGLNGGEMLEDIERIPVRVRLAENRSDKLAQIEGIYVPLGVSQTTGSGPGLLMSSLGDAELVPSQSAISRENGERINTAQAFLTRGVLPDQALSYLLEDLEKNPIVIPPGYRLQVGGDADMRENIVGHLISPMGVIIAAMVVVIVLTFNSWRLSAIAGFVCICSLGLSLLALALFRYPFGIQAIIGVIGSIGVSINAAIIIMTALQRDASAAAGSLLAIRNVVMDSSRHIVSTTVTTFGGFLPLILAGGGFWPPFATAIAGGVLLSTLVSFFMVPPLFAALNRPSPITQVRPIEEHKSIIDVPTLGVANG
ncbi:MAG: efflux RND transporter permease subunit [Pseudomonadota bacterium]